MLCPFRPKINTLARVVLSPHCHFTNSTQALVSLHWLPVKHRINFKIACLTHSVIARQQPSYLHNRLSHYTPARNLRSSNSHLLSVPRTSTSIACRGFHHCALEIWNSLPAYLRTVQSKSSFWSQLKTHFYCLAF